MTLTLTMDEARELIAEALSERTGEPLTAGDVLIDTEQDGSPVFVVHVEPGILRVANQ